MVFFKNKVLLSYPEAHYKIDEFYIFKHRIIVGKYDGSFGISNLIGASSLDEIHAWEDAYNLIQYNFRKLLEQ